MPWANVQDPSLGLSILHSICDQNRIDVKVFYLNQHLLKYIKYETYIAIAEVWAVNDFLFSGVLDTKINSEQISLLLETCDACFNSRPSWKKRFSSPADALDVLLNLRQHVIPNYLEECANIVLEDNSDAIGFTCLFDQTMASVALAKLIKIKSNIPIALGGYSVAGKTARTLLQSFPFIDTIIEGDGEHSLVEWLSSINCGGSLSEVSGANYLAPTNTSRALVKSNPAKKINLNISPIPNFKDFFNSIDQLKTESNIHISNTYLPIESSRGCWWGEKSHCTFCGIDNETLKYRQKSPEKVLGTLEVLRNRHGDASCFSFVDYIIPHTFYKTLFPKLKDIENKYFLTCETKSNTSHAKMKLFAEAGFREIQPGIESFSSNLLKQMDKGVSAAQNVLTIKLGRIFGIDIHYNILMGFPNESIDDYEILIVNTPLLYHLDPPMSCVQVLVTRNAPLQYDSKRFGYSKPIANQCYELLFTKEYREKINFELDDYAYVFERPYPISKDLKRAHKILRIQVEKWKEKYVSKKTILSFTRHESHLIFEDTRFSKFTKSILTDQESQVYLSCDLEVMTPKKMARKTGLEINDVNSILKSLSEKRLIFKDEDRYIGLGLYKNNPNIIATS